MAVSYEELSKSPQAFVQLVGMEICEFQEVILRIKDEWQKMEGQKKCHGRNSRIKTLEDKMLCVLIYHRACISYPFLGRLFDLHNSNVCRLLKKMGPLLLMGKITIVRDNSLTAERIMKIVEGAALG